MSEEKLEVQDELLEETVEVRGEDLSEEQKLMASRTGKFEVELSATDATYLRNILNKAEYKGSREAYLLILARAELSSTANYLKSLDPNKRHKVELTAATIESTNYFIEKKTGVGADSAQKLFSASMVLRQSTIKIQEIDKKLESLKKEQEFKDK